MNQLLELKLEKEKLKSKIRNIPYNKNNKFYVKNHYKRNRLEILKKKKEYSKKIRDKKCLEIYFLRKKNPRNIIKAKLNFDKRRERHNEIRRMQYKNKILMSKIMFNMVKGEDNIVVDGTQMPYKLGEGYKVKSLEYTELIKYFDRGNYIDSEVERIKKEEEQKNARKVN